MFKNYGYSMKPLTTHWCSDGDLHIGTLDDCEATLCVARRRKVLDGIR